LFGEIIFSNEYITLILLNTDVMLLVKKIGCTFEDFQEILKEHPRIKITEFAALKNALSGFENRTISIGTYREEMELLVSSDRLSASVRLNSSDEEFAATDRKIYLDEIVELLRKEGIVYGIEWENILDRINNKGYFKVASGQAPENGKDAIISLYKMNDLKPVISDDSKINYYEMELINKVEKGEWLGERREPTEGIPGKTIYGQMIPPIRGEQKQLKYDANSVVEIFDEKKGITYLNARFTGEAYWIESETIAVNKLLTIPNKVDFETGNISFEGAVEIKDTVEDNFSVVAKDDIQILGELGVGAVGKIESRNGNIYIKGGIAGRDKAKIICRGNLYTKFASNCTIECAGTVNIGYYAINCNIEAKEIVFESKNSRVIGGSIQAQVKIETAILGNEMGARTVVKVLGFKRTDLKKQFDHIEISIEKAKEKLANIRKKILIYKKSQKLSLENAKIYDLLVEENDRYTRSLTILLEERKKCVNYFKVKGEGEIFAKKRVYSNVLIQIREERLLITEPIMTPMIYYFSENQIKTI